MEENNVYENMASVLRGLNLIGGQVTERDRVAAEKYLNKKNIVQKEDEIEDQFWKFHKCR